jgi:hypothetical protein
LTVDGGAEINADRIIDFSAKYHLTDVNGQIVMKIKKEPALFETGFSITQERPMSDEETLRAVLGAFKMVLLERIRGWLSFGYLEKYSIKYYSIAARLKFQRTLTD